MTDQIKNRVVGAIVLFTLAIIFLPNIFDGQKNSQKEAFAVIPVKPTVVEEVSVHEQAITKELKVVQKTHDIPDQQQPTTVVTSNRSTNSNVVTSSALPQPTVVIPTLTRGPKPKVMARSGWVIQMGIFKESARVKPYLLKLRQHGYDAFSVPRNPRSGESTTVYVGPNLDKQVLVKLQPKLKVKFNESGYIKKFNPVPNK